ncbi:MAG: ribonuclease HI family protein, partial [bacterium]|nr:ribonuclease HI family protein [bacterium]
ILCPNYIATARFINHLWPEIYPNMISLNYSTEFMIKILNIFTDGGARGNPGPSAIGVYMEDEKNKNVAGFGKTIGTATNNVAEYKAVVEALNWIIENKKELAIGAKITFHLDSRLVCSQIIGLFQVKNADLRNLLFDVREREAQVNFPIYYKNIPREQNAKADAFVNEALDNYIKFDLK